MVARLRLAFSCGSAFVLAAVAGCGAPPEPDAEALATEAPASEAPAPPHAHPVLGDADAPVRMIMYGGFQDPFSRRFVTETLPQIRSEYIDGGRLALEYRNLPLSFHDQAYVAALASECAYLQGDDDLFWDFFQGLMAAESWDLASLASHARAAGLDMPPFDACMAEHRHVQPDSVVDVETPVDLDLLLAREAGVRGTPSFFIGGRKLTGAQPYEAFAERIDDALATVAAGEGR